MKVCLTFIVVQRILTNVLITSVERVVGNRHLRSNSHSRRSAVGSSSCESNAEDNTNHNTDNGSGREGSDSDDHSGRNSTVSTRVTLVTLAIESRVIWRTR